MFTTIPASRAPHGRPVRIFAPLDSPDELAPLVRSFLKFSDGAKWSYDAGETDTVDMSAWRYDVNLGDGRVQRFTFDGVEVVRSGAYIPATADSIRAEMLAWNRRQFPHLADDESPDTPSGRSDKNRETYCRRTLAKAMGFANVKDWLAAGHPIDNDKMAGIKPHKLPIIIADANLSGNGGIPTYTTSAIRPNRIDTGFHSAVGSFNK